MEWKKHINRRICFSLLSVLLICITSTHSLAQTNLSKSRRANQQFSAAQQELQLGRYAQAINHLLAAVKADEHFAEAHQGLGDLYRQNKEYTSAIQQYRRVLDINPILTNSTWFGLGESLLRTGQYGESITALQHYQELLGPNEVNQRTITAKYIQDCLFSIDFFRTHPQGYPLTPINAGPAINTAEDEYFPKLTADRKNMIFTRRVKDQENFYFTEQTTANGAPHWSEATLLQGDVNSTLYNEGAHSISPDGKHLYFTGCNRPGGFGSCDIYVSRRRGDQWGPPVNLGAPINTSGWEAQPALSADGQTLYFVSNRQGGLGGYDIWKSQMQTDGKWGQPENLGPKINTVFDEDTPFIHADNQTLYFSSTGWPGFGDKDIYQSTLDSVGNWQIPSNLGYPINNHLEQSAWWVAMNGTTAYFASRKTDGFGGLDIYHVSLESAFRPAHVAYINGLVVDAQTGQSIPRATIRITELNQLQHTYKAASDSQDGSFLAPLRFGYTYALHVDHPNFLFHSSHFNLLDSQEFTDTFELTIALNRAEIGHSETLNNIFFDVGQYELLPESQPELDKLIEYFRTHPGIRIEIGGHTDHTGTAQDNQILSEQRASAVRNHLIQAGISPSRIEAKGYADQQPLTSNYTHEGRQKNRRTDFKIIGN